MPRPGQFAIVVPSANAGVVTIRLDDGTGLVRNIAGRIPATVGTGDVTVAAADPTVVVVRWSVGGCTGDSDLALSTSGDGYRLSVRARQALGPCDLLILYGREVALTMREPIDPATVVLQYQP